MPNPTNNNLEVDVLIGTDHYYDFITGNIRADNQPVNQNQESHTTMAENNIFE